jgi:hypothetical protein
MSEWISVKDRLPITVIYMEENNLNFHSVEIICFDGDNVYADYFDAGNTLHFWGSFASTKPTHWMSLPKPPKS